MMRRLRRGGNAIEFALIMPALVAMLFGLLEFSWYFNRYMVVSAAARDAARRAAMIDEDEDAEAVAEAVALAYLAKVDTIEGVDVTGTITGVAPTRTVTVVVTRAYTPIAGSYIPAPDQIQASFSLRMEEQL